MGRAYAGELAALSETYTWACGISIQPIEQFVDEAQGRPLLTIGSGGSATAAHLAALLHRSQAGTFSRHATPLDVLLTERSLHGSSALILSASGKNRDALAALEHCIRCDVHTIATLCTQQDSPLAQAAARFGRAYIFGEEGPSAKDGFLATNSLLATCVFLARAYGIQLPDQLIPGEPKGLPDITRRLAVEVLYGGWGSPIATDLESKLNESAIASAQVSDYRNFGHGRHLWLARRPSETFVIQLVTPDTARLAERTRALLPPDVPVQELRTTRNGPLGTIDLLLQGFSLVGELAKLQSFDPGRPTVPAFGRKLYSLSPRLPVRTHPAPVSRKIGTLVLDLEQQNKVASAFERFVKRLQSTILGGIVLDYDGTLCAPSERFDDLRPELANECHRLLEGGLVLGIATGRGRSVRQSLQKAIPMSQWDRVIIGYYNGGEVASLNWDHVPSREAKPEYPLDIARDLLARDQLLIELATLTVRSRQITVEPIRRISIPSLMSLVMTVLAPLEEQGVRVLSSSHSVDVLPLGVGKRAVVRAVMERTGEGSEVLCIGDRGAWPGNDFALLSHEPSLSVDEVSTSMMTCWNLSPPGVSGAEATVRYLRAIQIVNDRATIDVQGLWEAS